MSDTPETDQAVLPYYCTNDEAPSVVYADHARRLERQRDEARKSAQGLADAMVRYAHQRDAYAETIREFLRVSDECAEDRRGFMRLLKLADEIEERHPELAQEATETP